ncbi:MAG: c-type cytochrome [Proteobacteria bacterium]|nr:c-type cytochrome [Pseudomonadota bacterium]
MSAASLSGKDVVDDKCVSCHDVVGPAPGTFNEMLRRQAPDLFYAGSKFNRPWLIDWLQNPTPIRYSGNLFLNYLVVQGGKDMLAADAVKPHPRLEPKVAKSVADYLMTLKDKQMKEGVIDRGKKIRKPKAVVLFRKRLPCVACHRIKLGARTVGGISGPDLTEAGLRLNPDWVYSMIENPQYWDPKIAMPKLAMSHKKRETLTLLIASLKKPGERKNKALSHSTMVATMESETDPLGMRGHPADENYRLYCVQCHGSLGTGRGINDSGGGLTVSPKNHTLAKEMSKLSDENLHLAISEGGDAVQSSGLMPPWGGTLSKKAIQDLVIYLRLLCQCKGP